MSLSVTAAASSSGGGAFGEFTLLGLAWPGLAWPVWSALGQCCERGAAQPTSIIVAFRVRVESPTKIVLKVATQVCAHERNRLCLDSLLRYTLKTHPPKHHRPS